MQYYCDALMYCLLGYEGKLYVAINLSFFSPMSEYCELPLWYFSD